MAVQQHEQVSPEFLDAFVEAWNTYDVERILSFFHDDVVFDTSSGDEVYGKRFDGLDGARQAIERVIQALPEYQFSDVESFVLGDRGVAEWTMTHSAPDGERISVRGCDLFRFRDGKISHKDSYRKNRPNAAYQAR